MKYLSVILLVICLSFSAYAQNKLFTVKETEVSIRKELAPQNLQNIQWMDHYNFTHQTNDTIFKHSVQNNVVGQLISLSLINTILKTSGMDTLSTIPPIKWSNDNEFCFVSSKGWFSINIADKKLTNKIKLPDMAENARFNATSTRVAYTLDNNVYVMGPDGNATQISHDNNPEIISGQTVSRNEFGIEEGIFWSPKGNFLAFYRKDNRNVGNYPLVDITSREAILQNIKYPMAGMPSEHVSVGIFNLTTGTTRFIERQDSLSEKYLTNVTWACLPWGI